tara:strand:- start:153 stop:830 length:678 start_codon:yes stop_codon:yes gene_type:complete
MIWSKKYNYPSSTRSIFNGYRHYDINNEKLPSVTSIIEATKTEDEKANLALWKERVGHQEAQRISKEAASRGGLMHQILEQYLLGKLNADLLEDNNKAKKMADEIIKNGIKGKLHEIWGCEATLYYPGKYAGAADCIGIYEGQPTILDFKQSNKPRKPQYNNNYYIQVSLYAAAHDRIFNTNITQGVILVCTSDYLFQSFKIDSEEFKQYQKKGLERVEQFYLQK